jgi:hypothetical protein
VLMCCFVRCQPLWHSSEVCLFLPSSCCVRIRPFRFPSISYTRSVAYYERQSCIPDLCFSPRLANDSGLPRCDPVVERLPPDVSKQRRQALAFTASLTDVSKQIQQAFAFTASLTDVSKQIRQSLAFTASLPDVSKQIRQALAFTASLPDVSKQSRQALALTASLPDVSKQIRQALAFTASFHIPQNISIFSRLPSARRSNYPGDSRIKRSNS